MRRVAQLQRDRVIAFEQTFCSNLKSALITTYIKVVLATTCQKMN